MCAGGCAPAAAGGRVPRGPRGMWELGALEGAGSGPTHSSHRAGRELPVDSFQVSPGEDTASGEGHRMGAAGHPAAAGRGGVGSLALLDGGSAPIRPRVLPTGGPRSPHVSWMPEAEGLSQILETLLETAQHPQLCFRPRQQRPQEDAPGEGGSVLTEASGTRHADVQPRRLLM